MKQSQWTPFASTHVLALDTMRSKRVYQFNSDEIRVFFIQVSLSSTHPFVSDWNLNSDIPTWSSGNMSWLAFHYRSEIMRMPSLASHILLLSPDHLQGWARSHRPFADLIRLLVLPYDRFGRLSGQLEIDTYITSLRCKSRARKHLQWNIDLTLLSFDLIVLFNATLKSSYMTEREEVNTFKSCFSLRERPRKSANCQWTAMLLCNALVVGVLLLRQTKTQRSLSSLYMTQ